MGDGEIEKRAGFLMARRRLLAIAAWPLALMAAAPDLAARLSRPVRNAKPRKTRAMAASKFETVALVHLREQKFDEAIAVLETAVERELIVAKDSPSPRLLDLLATLYARKGRLEKLSDLACRVETAAQKCLSPTAMLERAGNWRDGQSKWRRDRANPNAIIKWRWTKHEAGGGAGKFVGRDDIVIAA